MRVSSDKAGLAYSLGLLAALLLPTTNLMRLDGLPLATLLEVVALLVVAPLVLWAAVRGALWGRLQRLRNGPLAAWLILGVVLVAKVVLLAAGLMQGWPGCYQAGIEPVASYRGPLLAPQCERSFDNPFFRGGATRFDRRLAFEGDNWSLGFLNSGRFDFYDWQPNTPLRTRLPFEASWSAPFETRSAGMLRVEYVGEGELHLAGVRIPLAPSYAQAGSLDVPLTAGISTMQLRYRFDDGSRSGQDPDSWGPRALLRVSYAADGAPPALLLPQGSTPWAPIALAADLALGLLVIASALALAISAGSGLLVVIVMAGAAVALCLLPAGRVDYVQRVFGGLPLLQVSFAGLAMLLLVVHARWRRLSPLVIYLALGALALASMRQAYPNWDYVSLRSAGNDNLAAESQARSILQTGSLQGEEAVFYHQPLYRYIKFTEHVLFGEGDVLYGSVVLLVALGGAFFALDRFRPLRPSGARGLVWMLTATALLGVTGYYMARFIRDGMAEYPTWVAMLWTFPLLFAPARGRDLIWGALLLGMASITRTNQIPGNGLVLLAALFLYRRRRWASWLTPLLVFGLACLLPLVHNLIYGGAFVLTTMSAGVAGNLILGPREWLGMLHGEAQAWNSLLSQMRLLSFVVPLDDWQAPVGMFAHVLMGAWLVLAMWTVYRRGWRAIWMLLLPLPYLLTHLVFVVQTYYPRHVIMAVLAMALAVLAVLKADTIEAQGPQRPPILPGARKSEPGMG